LRPSLEAWLPCGGHEEYFYGAVSNGGASECMSYRVIQAQGAIDLEAHGLGIRECAGLSRNLAAKSEVQASLTARHTELHR
jgi:hypothetical protein